MMIVEVMEQVLPANHVLVLLCDARVLAVDMLSLKPLDDAKFVKVVMMITDMW